MNKRWKPDTAALELLRQHYATTRTADLAEALGVSVPSIYAQASRMGLKKEVNLIAEMARQVLMSRPDHPAVSTRFQPGMRPWNMGMKGLDIGGTATRFKAGNRPHTWLPIGTLRINQDGVLERKFSDDPGAPHKRWRTVARLVWEEAHGPMPDGYAVVFKPGRASTRVEDITLDAVECITRADLMRRNTMYRYGEEVVKTIRMRGVLVRAINRKEKETSA